MAQQDPEQSFNINISEEVARGVYSNLAMVGRSQSEFVLDFVNLLPGKQPSVESRVILTADNIKRLSRLLAQHVYAFEQENGVIALPEDQESQESAPVAEA